MRERKFVDQEADRRILGHDDDIRARAAHTAARRIESRRVGQHQPRRLLPQSADVVEWRDAELLGADGRYGYRHVLRRGVALGARDDDFFKLRGRILRDCRAGGGDDGGDGGNEHQAQAPPRRGRNAPSRGA